jgi:hypothetical protein
VSVKAFDFNKSQQLSTSGMQQVQHQSVRKQQIPTDFNKGWNLVREITEQLQACEER